MDRAGETPRGRTENQEQLGKKYFWAGAGVFVVQKKNMGTCLKDIDVFIHS